MFNKPTCIYLLITLSVLFSILLLFQILNFQCQENPDLNPFESDMDSKTDSKKFLSPTWTQNGFKKFFESDMDSKRIQKLALSCTSLGPTQSQQSDMPFQPFFTRIEWTLSQRWISNPGCGGPPWPRNTLKLDLKFWTLKI